MERIVFMQTEDNMVTFERENGTTIVYPLDMVPQKYKSGDIIKATILGEDHIIFLGLDQKEMDRRQANIETKKMTLRERARRTTNEA